MPSPTPLETLTKRGLVSDVAKTFDGLGWFSPSTTIAKVLMQRLWELKVDWDDSVPETFTPPGFNGGQNYTYSRRRKSHDATTRRSPM